KNSHSALCSHDLEEISRLHHRSAPRVHRSKADGLYCSHLMKIVIADGLPASAIETLELPGWTIDNKQARPPDQLAADLADADALVVRSATKVTREIIEAAPRL